VRACSNYKQVLAGPWLDAARDDVATTIAAEAYTLLLLLLLTASYPITDTI